MEKVTHKITLAAAVLYLLTCWLSLIGVTVSQLQHQ